MDKEILVLARRDTLEAMRVAAGLTIFGHSVTLIMMSAHVSKADLQSEQAELLDLADIMPVTTQPSLTEYFDLLTMEELGQQIVSTDAVVNL